MTLAGIAYLQFVLCVNSSGYGFCLAHGDVYHNEKFEVELQPFLELQNQSMSVGNMVCMVC